MPGFRWLMGDYVGGDTAVHQAYKPYLCIRRPDEHAIGEVQIQPRDTTDLVFNLGWEPDVIVLIGYRPKLANGGADSAFGDRGGGMTMGVLGKGTTGVVQFTLSSRIRHAFEPVYSYWNEDCCYRVAHDFAAQEILRLEGTFDANGFTLSQVVNLYDQTDYVAWLAMKGQYVSGVMTTGETILNGLPGYPSGAMFLSSKHAPGVDYRAGYWDHMTGFASESGQQAAIWGGRQPTSWDWTTERWEDDRAIVLCDPAEASSFYGAEYLVGGRVTDWWDDTDTVTITRSGGTASVSHTAHGFATGQRVLIAGAQQGPYNGIHQITVTGLNDYTYSVTGTPATPATGTITATVGGINLDWPVYGNQLYQVGYVITGHDSDQGVLETNWETRPGGAQNAYPDGSNFQETSIYPDVILMAATNYNFSYSNTDPFDYPRSPGQFGFGGSGGLGWHATPFSRTAVDAFGVHTFGNAVEERGHYANSGTQYKRGYILAGQGSNSNPPAYHQHSVNVIPNPVIVGTNYRYAERHAEVHRIHVNPSDT